MAELQQSVVTDQDTRHQIQSQILQWEENLERLHCEQFRLRCYMASLQGGELPNPKVMTYFNNVMLNILFVHSILFILCCRYKVRHSAWDNNIDFVSIPIQWNGRFNFVANFVCAHLSQWCRAVYEIFGIWPNHSNPNQSKPSQSNPFQVRFTERSFGFLLRSLLSWHIHKSFHKVQCNKSEPACDA